MNAGLNYVLTKISHMQLGCHVSISGSIDKAVDNAVERKCSAFQIFTRNPRGWNAKELTDNDISNFKSKLKSSKIDRFATLSLIHI